MQNFAKVLPALVLSVSVAAAGLTAIAAEAPAAHGQSVACGEHKKEEGGCSHDKKDCESGKCPHCSDGKEKAEHHDAAKDEHHADSHDDGHHDHDGHNH